MKPVAWLCLLLLLIALALWGCSSQPAESNSNSTSATSTPGIKTGAVADFELLNAWKPKTVIVQVYGGDKFTLTAKPGTEFIALELMMKTDEAKPIPAAMWGGTVLIDSKGNRSQTVFSYAATLVEYQPGGDKVEYVGKENMKDGELLGLTLKEAGGKLVVVFGAPEKDAPLKLEVAKTTTLDVSTALGGK